MLFPKYPYRVLSEENLDYILEQLKAIRAASGVTFDDSNAQLGATTVQEAIDALDAALEEIALQSTNLILINDAIPAAFYVSGHVYTHLQTVNNPTLMSLISAIRGGKMVIMKRTHTEGTDTVNDYAFLVNVTDDPVNIVHTCEFYDLLKDETSYIKLNGLNDDANVYGEIGVSTVKPLVSSFNNREGEIEPESGDYPASLIPFDNTDTGLSSDNVQDVIKEINAKAGVSSFNNRDGAVEPESGDYPASLIPFDNTDTGLSSDNVQDAIVEIKDDVLSSGVASFNGRNGAVNPQSGDYTAAMISYQNTIGNVQVNDVKAALDELISPSVITVTLTLNGAKEDSITIKDADNVTVATCAFASGQTSGNVSIEVPVGGGTFTFISSVTKDIATGNSDYEKTVTLTDALTQTVNVYPDNMYWAGNAIYGIGKGTYNWTSGQPNAEPVYNTNNIGVAPPPVGSGMWFGVLNPVDVTSFSTLKILCTLTASAGNGIRVCADDTMSDDLLNAPFNTFSGAGVTGYNVLTVNISTLTGNKYIALGNGESNGITGVIHAIIFE